MKHDKRGTSPLAGLTIAAILLASTAGYVSALSRVFQSPLPFVNEERDFQFADEASSRPAVVEAASFQQTLSKTPPAWFVNAMPAYSSGRAREIWYLSLDRSSNTVSFD